MSSRKLAVPLALALVAFGAACDDDDDPNGPDAETFTATLTGAAERPDPVTTDATGSAEFTVDGSTVDFEINVEDIQGVVAAHIHGPAGVDAPAGVIVTLFALAAPGVDIEDGPLVTGTFPSTTAPLATGITVDSVLVLMRNGNAYVNVHTVTNGAGEIRGQLSESN